MPPPPSFTALGSQDLQKREGARLRAENLPKAEVELCIARKWHQLWGHVLLEVLATEEQDSRGSLSSTWISKTTKVVPSALQLLLARVSSSLLGKPSQSPASPRTAAAGDGQGGDRPSLLRRYALLLAAAKKAGFVSSRQLEDLAAAGSEQGTTSSNTSSSSPLLSSAVSLGLVREALQCSQPNVRLDALTFVCSSIQTAAEPAQVELDLLRVFLPDNMANTTTTHRQRIFSTVSALLLRLRGAWTAAVAASDKIDAKVQKTMKKQQQKQQQQKEEEQEEEEEEEEGPASHEIPPALQQALDDAFHTIVRTEEKLTSTVLWMVDLCEASLFPGACYQRRFSALKLLSIVAGVVEEAATPVVRARADTAAAVGVRKCPPLPGEIVPALARVLPTLVHALQDNFDETRELACSLLVGIHHLCEASDSGSLPGGVAAALWAESIRLMDSAKATAADTAATYALAFARVGLVPSRPSQQQREADTQRDAAASEEAEGGERKGDDSNKQPNAGATLTASTRPRTGTEFVQALLAKLRAQVALARAHPLRAAKEQPIHGALQTLDAVLSVVAPTVPTTSSSGRRDWAEMLRDVVAVCTDVVTLCLSLLSASAAEDTRAMPSFEDMGTALTAVVQAEGGEVSRDYPYIMSFMWLNIRNACRTLASAAAAATTTAAAAAAPQKGTGASALLLTRSDLTAIKDTMCLVLRRCRHRGAIESTALALTALSQHMQRSRQTALRSLPQEWLAAEIGALETNEDLSSLSVTRRSAGLPHIVHSIALARNKGSRQLHPHLDKLMALAGGESCAVHAAEETQDMRQVHCLNVLKVLFAESMLNLDTQQHVSPAMVLAVRGFSSPVWSLRNASLQLFGILLQRVLGGVRLETDDRAISITTQDFVARCVCVRACACIFVCLCVCACLCMCVCVHAVHVKPLPTPRPAWLALPR